MLVGTVILFRCKRFSLDDLATVIVANDLPSALAQIASADVPIVLLIGTAVDATNSERAIRAVVARWGFFLRLRDHDDERWLRRMVRFALRSFRPPP